MKRIITFIGMVICFTANSVAAKEFVIGNDFVIKEGSEINVVNPQYNIAGRSGNLLHGTLFGVVLINKEKFGICYFSYNLTSFRKELIFASMKCKKEGNTDDMYINNNTEGFKVTIVGQDFTEITEENNNLKQVDLSVVNKSTEDLNQKIEQKEVPVFTFIIKKEFGLGMLKSRKKN